MVTTASIWLGWAMSAHAWLELDLTQPVVKWGETLTGNLVLEGKSAPHRITDPVYADLSCKDVSARRTIARQPVTRQPHTVESGVTQRFPLQLPIPSGVPFQHPLELRVRIYSGLLSQYLTQTVWVMPPAPYPNIVRQLMAVVGMSFHHWSLSASGDIIAHLEGRSPESLFRTARLELSGLEAPWRGRLCIQKMRHRFVAASGEPLDLPPLPHDPSAMREVLAQWLWSAGYRLGSLRHLPLPSEPTTREVLGLPVPSDLWPAGEP